MNCWPAASRPFVSRLHPVLKDVFFFPYNVNVSHDCFPEQTQRVSLASSLFLKRIPKVYLLIYFYFFAGTLSLSPFVSLITFPTSRTHTHSCAYAQQTWARSVWLTHTPRCCCKKLP
jgi:hypothetical protein